MFIICEYYRNIDGFKENEVKNNENFEVIDINNNDSVCGKEITDLEEVEKAAQGTLNQNSGRNSDEEDDPSEDEIYRYYNKN